LQIRSSAYRDRSKELGLGLAIAGGLAKTLGQDLFLRCTSGRGSVFRLALPIADVAAIKDEAFDGTPLLTGEFHARLLVTDDEDAVRAGIPHLLRAWAAVSSHGGNIRECGNRKRRQTPKALNVRATLDFSVLIFKRGFFRN